MPGSGQLKLATNQLALATNQLWLKLGLLTQSAVALAEKLAKLKHSARLGKTFRGRWVVGRVAEKS